MKVIHDLAAAATGFSTDRGDQLIVESLPFESTLNLDPPAPQDSTPQTDVKKLTLLEQLKSEPKVAIGAGAALVVILGGLFFVLRRSAKNSNTAEAYATPVLGQSSGEAAGSQLARVTGAGEQDSWAPSSSGNSLPALAPARIEVLTKNLRETAQKDAEICAGVLRGWLKEERT